MRGGRLRRGDWVLGQLRRLGFGRNAMRRGVDRVEGLVLVGLLVAAVLVVPGALGVGGLVRERAERSAQQVRAETRQVKAWTAEDTSTPAPGVVSARIRVRWVDAAGLPREGHADVLIGTKAGTELTVWLDRSGAQVRQPKKPADSAALGGVISLTLVMVVWPLLWAVFRLVRWSLDRRRAREWARGWEQVSPRWMRTY